MDVAGAASGLLNTFHQLGSSLGIGILVTASAAAGRGAATAAEALAERVGAALTAGSVMLGLCPLACLVLVVPAKAGAGTRR